VQHLQIRSPLAVCKGLVLDRTQRVLNGTSVFRTRRCRASYGIVRDEIYRKTEHKGRESYKNPVDGRKYAVGHIRWFIKKGERIKEDEPAKLDLTRTASFGNPDKSWKDVIVTSKLPPDCLPQYLGQGDSKDVCTVTSRPEPDTLTSKRNYLALGRKFLQWKYEMLVFMEQEGLRFETRVNGEKAGEYQTLQVSWVYTEDNG
jgi:hypothetical protein